MRRKMELPVEAATVAISAITFYFLVFIGLPQFETLVKAGLYITPDSLWALGKRYGHEITAGITGAVCALGMGWSVPAIIVGSIVAGCFGSYLHRHDQK